MDPLADKLTQISVLSSLVIVDIIPVWILAIVVLKELIMVIGASFLYGKDVVVYSKWYGKLATVLFYLAIAVSLLNKQFALNFSFDIVLSNSFATGILNPALSKPKSSPPHPLNKLITFISFYSFNIIFFNMEHKCEFHIYNNII